MPTKKPSKILSDNDEVGFEFENQIFIELMNIDFLEYIRFENPIYHAHEWKKHIGEGCDLRLVIHKIEIQIEAKFHRQLSNGCQPSFWKNDTVKRFQDIVPYEGVSEVRKFVVTNMPEFYKNFIDNQDSIRIVTLEQLMDILSHMFIDPYGLLETDE